MSARVGAIAFPNPYTETPTPRVPGSYFFGFLAFVQKKEESEKPKREEEQRR